MRFLYALFVFLLLSGVAEAWAVNEAPVGTSLSDSQPCATPVQCFVDPCRFKHCASGECQSNYCGGCNAICTCREDAQCDEEEICGSEGKCVAALQPQGEDDEGHEDSGGSTDDDDGHGEQSSSPTAEFDRCSVVRCTSDTRCVDGACVPLECTSNGECSERAFCNRKGKCQPQASCSVPSDCPAQGWMPLIRCLGHFTCEEGQCGYRCGPAEELKHEANAASCAAILCPIHTRCEDGQCLPLEEEDPSCAAVTCLTGSQCIKGQCVPQDDPFYQSESQPGDSCDESRPCSSGHFCSTRGVCLKQFACCSVADCEGNPTTAFRRRPVCAGGHFRCERGECRWTCSGSNSRSGGGRHDNPFRGEQSSAEDSVAKVDAVVAATAKKSFSAYVDDPERREYEEEEQFSPCPYEDPCATVRCAAGYECEKGHCVHASCSRNTDCGDEGYCASNKFCLPRGFCQLPADCAKDPSFFHPMCVGNYGCTAAGRCTFTCGREKLTLVVKGSDESASSSPAADRHVF